MNLPIFIALTLVITVAALFVSLKQRWVAERRTLILRSAGIWALASAIVVFASLQLLGPAPVAIYVLGPLLVVTLAGAAGAAR
ncbi:MAG: hypothetical protein ACKVVP_00430 [Chloroflexota bacterium]